MTEQEYISLIVRDCNNDLNETEQKALGSWISADVENKNIYLSLKKDWEKASTYKSDIKIDKSAAWQKIESKMAIQNEPKVVSIASNKKWYSMAAAVVVLLATTFFVNSNFLNNGFVSVQTAQNETKTINLPDGSTVFLNENSTLKYNESFVQRDVSLKGEAFFEVTKDKEHPFSVKVNETTTQVLGTSFNIDAYKKGQVEVALLTGQVKFSNANNNSVVLEPGETAVYDKHTAIFSLSKNNNQNSISWKTNKLVFENTKLSEVIKNLNDYYKTDVNLVSKDTESHCTFTGTFENAKISEVLEVVSFSLNADLVFSNNSYTISAIDCK